MGNQLDAIAKLHGYLDYAQMQEAQEEAEAAEQERLEEEAAELAAPLAPKPGIKLPGEIKGTIEGEDVDTHQQAFGTLEPETSEQ